MPVENQKQIDHMKIISIIKRIRESFSNSVEVYTRGSCYRFAGILKEIYPQGTILDDQNHGTFLLHGRCYDITGVVPLGRSRPLTEEGCNKVFDIMNLTYPGEGEIT